MITTVPRKNQITIPAKLASQLNIQPGTRLDWSLGQDGVIVVRPLPSRGEMARRAAGMGRSWLPEASIPWLTWSRNASATKPLRASRNPSAGLIGLGFLTLRQHQQFIFFLQP